MNPNAEHESATLFSNTLHQHVSTTLFSNTSLENFGPMLLRCNALLQHFSNTPHFCTMFFSDTSLQHISTTLLSDTSLQHSSAPLVIVSQRIKRLLHCTEHPLRCKAQEQYREQTSQYKTCNTHYSA